MLKSCKQIVHKINKSRLFTTNINTEMKYLNVAEKNDAAKTISGFLSKGTARRREGFSVYNKIYEFEKTVRGTKAKMVMTSVSGHLLSLEFLLSYKNWTSCDPIQLFDAPLKKSCNQDFLPIKKTLEREIKTCQGLIIWTDCDREGENIGFEIIDVCKAVKPNISVFRAKFSEITTAAVERSLANLIQPDIHQNNAVNIRTELDLRTGAAITRYQTLRLQRLFPEKIASKLISYGSCQFPTLGFVAERYKEVEAFVSEPFWKIKVSHTIDELTVDFNWARNRLFDKEACEDYLMICLSDPKATVEKVNTKPKKKWRPAPMDTVEMEKLGSRKLKLSAKETMTIAEKLYTQGIISYPRTETNMFSKEIDLKKLVEHHLPSSEWGNFAQRIIDWGPNPRNGNKSDQAHPPIHPIKLVTNLSGNEARVYELIVRHFLACVSKDAVGSETIVNIDISGEKFSATGLCIHERNYLDVYIYENWNSKRIHAYEVGQIFEPTELSMQEGATTAPPLLTEADLIALMEKHGIGTDATHAEHINTIKERGYIGEIDRGFLVPGVIGMALYESYEAMDLSLAKPMLRAEFEADLKLVCLGQKDHKLVLRDQIQKYKEAYKLIEDKVTAMDEKMSIRLNETAKVTQNDTINRENRICELFTCPKCGSAPMALRKKKNSDGYFIGCLNFPDCKNAIWLPDELKEVTSTQESCARCGSSSKMLKTKFSTAYHRSMFDPSDDGFYKTCLRCDGKFRETFNINTDQVKRTGAIVGDSTVLNINSNMNQNKQSATATLPKRQRLMERTSHSNVGSNKSKAKPKSIIKTVKRSIHTESVRQVEEINDFFNSNDGFDDVLLNTDLDSINCRQPSAELVSNDLISDLDSIFMNDDFDLNWDNSDQTNTNNCIPQNRTQENMVQLPEHYHLRNFRQANERSDDDNFNWGTSARTNITSSVAQNKPHENRINANDGSFSWGTTGRRNPTSPVAQNNSQESRHITDNDFSWGSGSRMTSFSPQNRKQENKTINQTKNEENFSWGTSGKTKTTNSFSNQTTDNNITAVQFTGNQRYSSNQPITETRTDDFSWGTSGKTSKSTSLAQSGPQQSNPAYQQTKRFAIDTRSDTDIQCKCKIPAKSLTVRKEGPNQGRPFYTCATQNKSCGFFQWGDITSSTINDPGLLISRPSTSGQTSTVTENSQNERKQRKCGICRKEGHVRSKCPRKAEFEL